MFQWECQCSWKQSSFSDHWMPLSLQFVFSNVERHHWLRSEVIHHSVWSVLFQRRCWCSWGQFSLSGHWMPLSSQVISRSIEKHHWSRSWTIHWTLPCPRAGWPHGWTQYHIRHLCQVSFLACFFISEYTFRYQIDTCIASVYVISLLPHDLMMKIKENIVLSFRAVALSLLHLEELCHLVYNTV
jgi:hypothetical protein